MTELTYGFKVGKSYWHSFVGTQTGPKLICIESIDGGRIGKLQNTISHEIITATYEELNAFPPEQD